MLESVMTSTVIGLALFGAISVPVYVLGDYAWFWAVVSVLNIASGIFLVSASRERGILSVPEYGKRLLEKLSARSVTGNTTLQPASAEAQKETEGTVVMTLASSHPLAGKTSAFSGIVGFIAMLMACTAVFAILTGAQLGPGLQIGTVLVPWEAFVVPAALLIYKHQRTVSLTRPSTWGFGLIDFLSSLLMFVVVAVGVASWHPKMAALLTTFGLPVASFSSLVLVTAATFILFSVWDLWTNHIRRAKYGKARLLQLEEQQPLAASEAGDNLRPRVIPDMAVFSDGFTVLPQRNGYDLSFNYVARVPREVAAA